MITAITESNFEEEIKNSSKPVVLDVYAIWCGPCKQMGPIFEELDKEYGSVYSFAKLNVDEAREISIKLNVTSVPTFIFMKNNEVKGRVVGALSKEDLYEKIVDYLG